MREFGPETVEHRVVRGSLEQVEREIGRLGEDGWRLVAVVPLPNLTYAAFLTRG